MKAYQHLFWLIILCALIGKPQNPKDTVYKRAWDTAMEDGTVNKDERALLLLLAESQSISPDSASTLEMKWLGMIDNKLDQSGRWPLVLQNMILGTGIYGWAIPFVLDAEDGRWYVGTEMLSLGGSFYLTYNYTRNMNISHARAHMMRYGGIIGLRYGFGINTIFELNSEFDRYNPQTGEEYNVIKKSWAWVLMASVPAGIWGGDWLYQKLEPSNGQAWALMGWTLVGGATMRSFTNYVFPDPHYGEDEEFENYSHEETEERDREFEKWVRKQTAIELLAGYPLGFYVGKKLTMGKQYTFGDALMLYQGYMFGFNNTMMLQTLMEDLSKAEFDENRFLFLGCVGAVGGLLYYDRWISPYDFTAGQAIMMALGSASGTAFGFGTAIITDTRKPAATMILALAGHGAGVYLTRKIVDVKKAGSLAKDEQKTLSMLPYVMPYRYNQASRLAAGISIGLVF